MASVALVCGMPAQGLASPIPSGRCAQANRRERIGAARNSSLTEGRARPTGREGRKAAVDLAAWHPPNTAKAAGQHTPVTVGGFAFDPDRQAIPLVDGDKSGVNEKRFCKRLIARPYWRFDRHLAESKGHLTLRSPTCSPDA